MDIKENPGRHTTPFPFEDYIAVQQVISDLTGVEQAIAPGNAHGVGIGFRMVNGRLTDQVVVRLYVLRKLPKKLVSRSFLLSSDVDGIPIDIVESDIPVAQTGINTEWTRPLKMGYSAAHVSVGAGTMGAVVEDVNSPGSQYLLSCSHVLAPPRAPGNAIRQPSRVDDFGPPRQIATLEKFTDVKLGVQVNHVDAALARLSPGILADNDLGKLGRLSPLNILRPGMAEGQHIRVAKLGRTTGYTEGIIDDWHCNERITVDTPEGPRTAWFEQQLSVSPDGCPTFSEAGDSGSIVVELKPNGRVIGMVIAGTFGRSIVTPIYKVLKVQGFGPHDQWEVRFI